jgi:hypothetical protein
MSIEENTRTLDDAIRQLNEVLEQHERNNHAGAPCMDERMNMVAWVAHRIGWTPRDGIKGAQDLMDLEQRIIAHKKHHDEDHNG